MTHWFGRPPQLNEEAMHEVLRIAERLHALERERQALPTTAELAQRFGVSEQLIRNYLRGQVPKRFAHLSQVTAVSSFAGA